MAKVNGKKVSKKNQLVHLLDFDEENLVFADVNVEAVPGETFSAYRVNMLCKNAKLDEEGKPVLDENGKQVLTDTYGDVMLLFDRAFTFGVSQSKNKEKTKVTGHTVGMAMHTNDGATEREIQQTNKIERIIQKCKEHIYKIRKELKKPKLEMAELKPMDNLLKWKEDEDGNRIGGPIFAPKLVERKEKTKGDKVIPYQMQTVFYHHEEVNENGNPLEVNPLNYISDTTTKNYFYATPVVKFDSIYDGSKITIQCKLTEAEIEPSQLSSQRLLRKPKTVKAPTYDSVAPLVKSKVDLESKQPEPPTTQSQSQPEPEPELELTDEPVTVAPKKKTTIVKKKNAENTSA
jgi:hypothetical protein